MTFRDEHLLDAIGWRILQELQQEARLSFHELGRRIGLSAPAVAERVRKMEDCGLIMGYGAKVNIQKVGLGIIAFVRLTSFKASLPAKDDLVILFPEVLECHRVTGTDSYVLKLALISIAHLEQVVNRLMPYGEPATSLVLSSIISDGVIRQEACQAGEDQEGR
ncbi:Lrp/AsnC family transcriptional regulator [Ktedonosporobacter rubrisoli]|uniref:Lrp/AsnC family transcriptional regulator n=1 Tax=Ktedonosporobacter rubrisoli TaxID=2509675 RepID=A0A4P6JIJ9_KTERU|nr:Lrp/AsnC family transcriptional regulator [Ktedonosporobacter rubrisoli]QBD74730.1 Lrp/AsnC family transcriptional regulator [Ktedonosporobacter rubrisoli]